MTDVMVVDDELGMRAALEASFRTHGWRVQSASGKNEAVRTFQAAPCPLVVTDMRMPDGDGFGVMQAIRAISPKTAFIFLTAFGTVQEAVSAMQEGACDFLIKPVSFDRLHETAQRILDRQPPASASVAAEGLVGRSPRFRALLDRIRHIAPTDADILIEAESGTGKEKLARFIHQSSHRRNAPFVAVNCAAFPESLLESELFGHVRGAFTGALAAKAGRFEMAQGGTLLLDEIGEMSPSLQPKLLRVLQEREVDRLGDTRSIKLDIRVIATTNRSLGEQVRAGAFRADLFYRLNVIPLSVPPLRERKEDIPELADYFLRRYAPPALRASMTFSREFIECLARHDWPGNVRELENAVRRAVALARGPIVGLEGFEPFTSSASRPVSALEPGLTLRELERQLVERTLESVDGNRTRASEMLGISLRTIRNKVREYGLGPRRVQ
ncbi:MAG: sigma-54-dependent transcriptional regulator [Terriglobia bacterium]